MIKIFKNKKELINDLIKKDAHVLDIGFWGQGVSFRDDDWVHRLIKNKTNNLFGIDLNFDSNFVFNKNNYFKINAEEFELNRTFDVIFAGDLVEHLENPDKFLDKCKKHIKNGGQLIITTPNTFNLFNIAGKITNREPVVNHDHTAYYNSKTITQLLMKNGWEVENIYYLYTLGVKHRESFKKKFLNLIYKILSLFTDKFVETMVVVAKVK